MLLYIAGVLTTTSFIGNGLLALIAHPEEIHRVRADPSRLPDVVEEVLRWDNPVSVVARTVFESLTVGSVMLRPGTGWWSCWGPATATQPPGTGQVARSPDRVLTGN
ncbi:MAG TPA: hypothetical protein VJT72_14560 [Pseudonocardiaceae bacterium]|nr:hypothetical protein [Pseudonocardiaceae bacterium]